MKSLCKVSSYSKSMSFSPAVVEKVGKEEFLGMLSESRELY